MFSRKQVGASATMEMRRLGDDGDWVSVIGLGAWPIGNGLGAVDETMAIDTIRTAIDLGITLVDTAGTYRGSEARIGKGLRDGYRDRCFLATKVAAGQSDNYSRSGLERCIDNSLRALNVDCVDLLQIHHWDSGTPVEKMMEAMARIQESGKARFIGVSNFSVEQLKKAHAIAPVSSGQWNYSLLYREIEKDLMPFCRRAGVGILGHSSLAKGLLTGKYDVGHRFPEDDQRATLDRTRGKQLLRNLAIVDQLKPVAADLGLSLTQLSIAWCIRQGLVSSALVGAKNPQQVREHVTATELDLGEDTIQLVEDILRQNPLPRDFRLVPFVKRIKQRTGRLVNKLLE